MAESKGRVSPRTLIGVALSLLVMGCSLAAINGPAGKKYLIVDQATGRTLTSITLAPGSTRPARIISYGPNQNITKEQKLSYNGKGELVGRDITVTLPGGGVESSRITYSYRQTANSAGRLVETVQTASNGKTITTYYGYDATGTARGVVVKTGSSLLMKDYAN